MGELERAGGGFDAFPPLPLFDGLLVRADEGEAGVVISGRAGAPKRVGVFLIADPAFDRAEAVGTSEAGSQVRLLSLGCLALFSPDGDLELADFRENLLVGIEEEPDCVLDLADTEAPTLFPPKLQKVVLDGLLEGEGHPVNLKSKLGLGHFTPPLPRSVRKLVDYAR